MKRKVVWVIGLIIPISVLAFSTFSSASICSRCGCRSYAIDLQLPLIPLTYYRHRRIEQTPLSVMGNELAFFQQHSHEWKLIQGGGNGILCALGNGGDLNLNARSNSVVGFLSNTNEFRGKQEAEEWFKTALNDRNSRAVHNWLQGEGFPEDGFNSAPEYETWRQQADVEWPEWLALNRSRWPE